MKEGLTHILRSFGPAGAGIVHLVQSERNARVHLLLTIVAVILALWLRLSAVEWALLILTIAFVWATEAVNTAIEATIDLASPDSHPLAKIAKDTAAGAVLISALAAIGVAVFLFLPRLLDRVGI